MTGQMLIQIRVASIQAQRQIRALEGEVADLRRQVAQADSAMTGMGSNGIRGITRWGNQIQWAGRQLQYNFTLPILLAGGAAAKFALDNEKAMTRVIKVYGDGSDEMNRLSKTEIPALEKAFEALSSTFGVAQADAINIAADWAAAGASGIALAKSVKLTMETMILGEIEAAEATQALIAIQAQYGFGVDKLSRTIDILNMTENQTGISMKGLIEGFSRAAGVARSAGIDVEHLAAMMAALTPAAGSAANAGNALKTIISRLLSPTGEAAEVMKLMGINTEKAAWQSLNGTQRLEAMAEAFDGLKGAQKAAVSSTIASRWQINRFDVLMRDMINTNGYYQKSLKATSDSIKNFEQRQRELNAVLDSNPQKLKQIWVILQNAMARVIQPMIPIILLLAAQIANLANWFQSLNPEVQKFTLFALLALAAVGPIARYIGSFAVLLGLMTEVFASIASKLGKLGSGLLWLAKAPFKAVGTGLTALKGLFLGMLPWLQTWAVASAAAVRTAFVASMAPVLAGMRALMLAMLRQMSALMVASFALMSRNLVAIWARTWTLILALTATGTTRVMAVMMIFSRNLLLSMTVLSTNLLALMKGLWLAMIAGFSRVALVIPLLFTRALPVIAAAMGAIGTAVAKLGPLLLKAFASGWFWAIAGALLLIYGFRDKLIGIWNDIVRGADKMVDFLSDVFWGLPEGMRDAMLAVVRVVRAAVMKVYEWFSYLNPFARHSPSLVEQVTAGMAEIKAQYASVGNVGGIFAKAARDIAAYKQAIGSMGGEFADERIGVAESIPKALPLFDALIADLSALNKILAVQEAQVAKQQAVVDKWAAALDQANIALDQQQNKLDGLQDKLDKLQEAYAAHEAAMKSYADSPIEGMGEMEDAIFANEMAQKRLRLEILKWEQANGSIEDVQNNMSKLAGSIEQLRGEEASLRAAGAGSDILGPIQGEIAAMQAAYDGMGDAIKDSPVNQMQEELEKLGKAGEILELEKAIKFDEMVREIDKLANAQKELSYDEIVAGIKAEQAAMAALVPQIAAAEAAVAAQQAAVDKAKASRDAISAAYDVENAKLDRLKDQYDATADVVRSVEDALRGMGAAAADASAKAADAARKAKEATDPYMSPGARNFLNAAGADDFPDVGGQEKIGREGPAGDQTALIDEFTKGLTDDLTREFEKFDMFAPIKEKWNEFTAWLEENVWSKLGGVEEAFTTTLTNIGDFLNNSGIASAAESMWDGAVAGIEFFWEWGKKVYDLVAEDFQKIWDEIVAAGGKIMKEIGPELEQFKDMWPGLLKILKVVGGFILVVLVGAFKQAASVLSEVLGPAIDFVIDIFKNAIKIIRGILNVIVGLFTGDFELMKKGVIDIFTGLVGGIVGAVKNLGKMLWGLVKGVVTGVKDFFVWLYDELVGHSIIPDMVNDIIDWFKGLPKRAWDALIDLKNKVVDVAKKAWDAMVSKSKELWNNFTSWLAARPQAAYDKFISIREKLRDAAKFAWDAMKSKSLEIWNTFNTWLGGRPQAAYDKFKSIKDKFVTAARNAFNGLLSEAKKIVDGKSGFMAWVGGIPGRIAGLLGKVGGVVGNAIQSAWNSVAKWINKNGISAVNKVTTKFGFTLGQLPTFEGGGVIPGRVSKKDNTIIAARTGEGVIVPELVRHLGGARGLAAANNAAKTGNMNALRNMGIERFADGGIIGKVTGWLQKGAGHALSSVIGAFKRPVREVIPGRPFGEDWAVGWLQNWQNKAKEWGNKQEAMGNGVLPGTGYQWQIKVLKERFPNAIITSSFRPGAITALGNKSMHGMGRAIDIAPRDDIFDWIRGSYGKNTKQLFYSPKASKNILNGRDWYPDGTTLRGHWDHIHWGYDKGGILPPGLTLAQNNTGRDEYTLTNSDFQTLSNVVSMMDRLTQKRTVAGAPGGSPVARMGATLATLESRLRAVDSSTTRGGRGGGDTFNFYGDLEFPNIENGTDAEEFVKNLRGLAG